MSLKDLFSHLYHDERTGVADPLAFAGRVAREVRRSFLGETCMVNEKLLIPRADAIRLKLSTSHYFHRDLVSHDASPDDQLKLLRRVRRTVRTEVMCDQQRIDPEGTRYDFTVTCMNEEPTISQHAIREGFSFYDKKRTEIERILGHEATLDEILMIGEDMIAHHCISELRSNVWKQPSDDAKDYRADELYFLQKATAGLTPEALKLYLALEIPIVWNDSDLFSHPHSQPSSGHFTIDHNPPTHHSAYVAAHELCHAMIGHDFNAGRIKLCQRVGSRVPEKFAEASAELNERMQKIASGDPVMHAQYEKEVSAGELMYEELQGHMKKWQDYSEYSRPIYAEKHKTSYEYEDVCNYYAMRQTTYAGEADIMRFVSPKMAELCDELELRTKRSLLVAQKQKDYLDNPARNKIFALIQKDDPVIKFPTKSVTLI